MDWEVWVWSLPVNVLRPTVKWQELYSDRTKEGDKGFLSSVWTSWACADRMSLDWLAVALYHLIWPTMVIHSPISSAWRNVNKIYSTSKYLEKAFLKVHVKHDVNPSISSETHLAFTQRAVGIWISIHNSTQLLSSALRNIDNNKWVFKCIPLWLDG